MCQKSEEFFFEIKKKQQTKYSKKIQCKIDDKQI